VPSPSTAARRSTKQAVAVNGSSDTTGDAVTRFVIRWLWRIDGIVNRAGVVTGRWCAAAINREIRRQRKGES
jgi:hypothetical protein